MPIRPICLALSIAFGLWAPPAAAIDLLESVRAASAIDPVVASTQAQLDAVKQRVPQARAGLLPTVSATAGPTFNAVNNTITSQRAYDAQSLGLVASVPVYRPANREAWKQSELSVEIAEMQLIQAQQDLILRVATAYFDVLAAQDSLAVVQAQGKAFAEQFESARRNFEVGTATITDQQEAQSRLDLTRAQEVGIRNDLEVKRALLAQLIGRPVGDLDTLRRDLDISTPEAAREGEWAAIARQGNYVVRQAEVAKEVAEREIQKQRAGHLPTLDITSQASMGRGTGGQTAANLVGVRTQFAQIGLQLALPIDSGGSIDARVREAIALQGKSEFDLENARRTAEQAARQGFLGVRSGIEQVRALTAAERSSQLALESNQLGYQVGVRINIDVLNAAQQLFSTQRDLAKARYDVLLNGLRLRNTAGELTEAEVAKVNALLEAPRAPAVGVTTGSTFPRAPAPVTAPAASPAAPASAGSGASAAGAASSAVPGAAATGVGAAPGAEGNRGGRSSLPRTPTR